MADQALCSALLSGFPVTTIPNGLNTDDFAPRDIGYARDILALPRDASVILFVADYVQNRRKGLFTLEKAFESISTTPGLVLLTVGYKDPRKQFPIAHLHLGTVLNNGLLSVAYSAADLLVIPSLEDNLPNTVIESMACGTPVVGYAAGGIPDMVRPGKTGSLVPVGDAQALGQAMRDLIEDPGKRQAMSENCRRIAVEEYSLETVAKRYMQLYEDMLGGNPEPAAISQYPVDDQKSRADRAS